MVGFVWVDKRDKGPVKGKEHRLVTPCGGKVRRSGQEKRLPRLVKALTLRKG